ncbi:MAG: hypothetical protein AAFV51_11405 [Pseudomonadota bacterium]
MVEFDEPRDDAFRRLVVATERALKRPLAREDAARIATLIGMSKQRGRELAGWEHHPGAYGGTWRRVRGWWKEKAG